LLLGALEGDNLNLEMVLELLQSSY